MCESIPAASIPPPPPPRANPQAYPGHLKKLFKCPALGEIFVCKCSAPRSYYNIISCITVSAHYRCIKQVMKWVTPTEKKRQSKWFYSLYRSFMVDNGSSPIPKWQCLTAWNPWLWALSEMTTGCYETRFLFFTNFRGFGIQLTAKCPAPGTHRASNALVLHGGMLAAGIDSHIDSANFHMFMWMAWEIEMSSHRFR